LGEALKLLRFSARHGHSPFGELPFQPNETVGVPVPVPFS
jgi:hypothetical protein